MSKIMVILFFFVTALYVSSTDGQVSPKADRQKVTGSIESNCEAIIGSIDRALAHATENRSNVIVIVKSERGTPNSRNLTRAKGLRNYFAHRGFKEYEIGVDVLTNSGNRVEIFVAGAKLFSLPIARQDDLDLSPCVLGVQTRNTGLK